MENQRSSAELSYKTRKTIFMCFSLACFIAAVVCLIVDLAISKRITWATYPLVSIAFGWAVLTPLLAKKHGVALMLCSLTLFNLPYLFLMSKITPATDWFVPVGLPSAVAGVVSVWLLLLLFRYVKIKMWYKASIAIFWCGVVASTVINYYVNKYEGADPFSLSTILSASLCIIASAALGIIGYKKPKQKKLNV